MNYQPSVCPTDCPIVPNHVNGGRTMYRTKVSILQKLIMNSDKTHINAPKQSSHKKYFQKTNAYSLLRHLKMDILSFSVSFNMNYLLHLGWSRRTKFTTNYFHFNSEISPVKRNFILSSPKIYFMRHLRVALVKTIK